MSVDAKTILDLPCYLGGEAIERHEKLEVLYPYTNSQAGLASIATEDDKEKAVEIMLNGGTTLTRYQRFEILNEARSLLKTRAEEFAQLIVQESGLCIREAMYEVGRAQDVLQFAAMESLKDDGQIFSCDVSPQGKKRKIFTTRDPLKSIVAITPFNHPLNQVAHKLAPAIAIGAPVILKPSEKTPLTAIRFAELLYEAGLPGWMLSVLVGSVDTVIEPLIRDNRIQLVSFTGSVSIGKHIADIAGYKKTCLELGGNSPLIILDDADMDLAVALAAEGCYRNSGQRCTAVKRLLVHKKILDEFTEKFITKTKEYLVGDPMNHNTRVGTVIDEAAAIDLENRIELAVKEGAKVLWGGQRNGAQLEPTVITDVPRSTHMVRTESFGPLAPIMAINDVDDAIELANSTDYGLSSGVVTQNLDHALRFVKELETGTVNINQVPGYRIECSPFGGIKDSGLGIKEGVIEAMKWMSTVKTFSLPW